MLLGAHYQADMYLLAEQVADIMLGNVHNC